MKNFFFRTEVQYLKSLHKIIKSATSQLTAFPSAPGVVQGIFEVRKALPWIPAVTSARFVNILEHEPPIVFITAAILMVNEKVPNVTEM